MEIAPTVSQSFSEPEPTIRLSYLVYSSILLDARGVGQVCPHRLQLKKKNIFFKTAIPKLGHKLTFLGKLNFKPTLEQVTPSRSSGKSLGADLPPLGVERSKK